MRIRLTIAILLLFIITPAMIAQDNLTESFAMPEGQLAFRYPGGWDVEVDEDDLVVLSRNRVFILIYLPTVLDESGFGDENDPATLVESIGALLENEDGGELSPIEAGGVAGASYAFYDEDGQPTLLIALPFAGKLIMFWATTLDDNLDELGEVVLLIAATLEQPDAPPASLQQHNASWQEAVAELENLGVISTGGELIFRENRAFFSGQGSFFTALAQRAPRTDIVMAGELTFRPGSTTEIETCTLLSRIVTNNEGNATHYLDVGLDNEGGVFYLDQDSEDDTADFATLDDFELTAPHHVLIIALDDRMTVYIDGELVFGNVPVVERSGSYGIALRGRGPQALCEGTNIWAYEAPSFQPGVCEISAGSTVNKRSGPGTSFDRAGQLTSGSSPRAQGQATGADGFVWWQLDDESWVRNDVVNAQGDCKSVPVVEG